MTYQTAQAKIWNGSAWQNAVQPKAVVSATTGSPTITTDGDATIYTFTGDGTITFSQSAGELAAYFTRREHFFLSARKR